MRNHLGQYECRLCLTLHNNEGNYLAHTQVTVNLVIRPTRHVHSWPVFVHHRNSCMRPALIGLLQGKRHQQNLAKRAAREAAEKPALPQPNRRVATKKTVKIGRPGYKVTKQYDPETMQRSLLFQVRTAQ